MRREYYLHKRKNGIYYVEFIDKVSGKKMSARSTEETEQLKAQVKAEFWKQNGIPTGKMRKPRAIEEVAGIENILKAIRKAELNSDDALRIVSALKSMDLIDITAVKNTGRGAVPFVRFLEEFWDYDGSPYIQDKLTHGYRFSRRYAHTCQQNLKNHIKPFFGEIKLNCVTTENLKKFTNQLSVKGLTTSSINHIVNVCSIALKWAFNEKIIPVNPAIGLTRFSMTYKERGVLTVEEAAAVFAIEWRDKRAYVASLVSATTGARLGECLALRRSDIGEDTLSIVHSFSTIDGLKCPKNGHKRIVPLLPEVKAAFLDLLNDNPHGIDDPFIFYSKIPDRPVVPNVILKGLYDVLQKIGVDYKSRNVCFHSWRHFFCSNMTQKIEGEKVAKVSGHLSEAVFKRYADHIETRNVQEVGNAAAQVFGKILPYRKAG